MNSSIIIRRYDEKDIRGVLDLKECVFRKKVDSHQWERLYLHNPAGKSFIAVSENKGKIVGFYAGIPFRFQFKSKEAIGLQVIDSMVAVGYSGKGLFRKMARMAFSDTWKRYGQKTTFFGYGFPNAAHRVIGKRQLGYNIIGKMRAQLFVINEQALKNRIQKRILRRIMSG
ncbi:GNAT family N-acetyltransferase, partial [PVC group bacterium]|nr:GNAT family N-acetyltransferase [PVC group bacterium]